MKEWQGISRSRASGAVEHTVQMLAVAYGEVQPQTRCAIHSMQYQRTKFYRRLQSEFSCTAIFEKKESVSRLVRDVLVGRPALLLPQLAETIPQILEATSAQAMAGVYFFDAALVDPIKNMALDDMHLIKDLVRSDPRHLIYILDEDSGVGFNTILELISVGPKCPRALRQAVKLD